MEVQHARTIASKVTDFFIKQKHAWPFVAPVDFVMLGIPDYPEIIT